MKTPPIGKSKSRLTRKQRKQLAVAEPKLSTVTRTFSTDATATTLETQEQTQGRFDAAIFEGVSPCNWIPPEWEKLEPTESKTGPKKFADNSSDTGEFDSDDPVKKQEIQDAINLRQSEGNAIRTIQAPETGANGNSWPHPFADTSHVDESEFSREDQAEVQTRLSPAVLKKLDRIVGPDSPGMKRLGRVFTWALYRASFHLAELNKGLKNATAYEAARRNYINFLRDLDDHEPEKGPKLTPRELEEKKKDAKIQGRPMQLNAVDKKSASGYGRSIKWTCIEPVIFGGHIVGTRVVVKWNPHVSSSGVAVQH